MIILKDIEKQVRLPPSCNRPDVRLYHNRNLAALTPKSWAEVKDGKNYFKQYKE